MLNNNGNTNKFNASLANVQCDDFALKKGSHRTQQDKVMQLCRMIVVIALACTFVFFGLSAFGSLIDYITNYQDDLGRFALAGQTPVLGRTPQPYIHGTFDEMLAGDFEFDSPPPADEMNRWLVNRAQIQNIQQNTNRNVFAIIAIYDPNGVAIINYPVVQGQDNMFYLNHRIDHVRSGLGSIFFDHRASRDFTTRRQNSMIYGHNITSPSRMFNRLHGYYNSHRFFLDHPIITIYTMYGVYEFTVFGVNIVHSESGHHRVSFPSDEAFLELMHGFQNNSRFHRPGITITAESRIIGLSTCTTSTLSPERLHIAAVMTNHRRMVD